MSRASEIDLDGDLFLADELEGDDLFGSEDVRALHSSTRRFVLLKPKQKFSSRPVRARKAKPSPKPKVRAKRAPTLTERLPKPTFLVCRPHYKLFRPKAISFPKVPEPSDYDLRRAEPLAQPPQLVRQASHPMRSDFALFKIGDTPDAVDAPMLSDLIDLCTRVLGHRSQRTDGEHTPFAFLRRMFRAVRYYARKDVPKAAREWTVLPKTCPTKPALAAVWTEIRQEIAQVADEMERDFPLYSRAYRLNAYSTFMFVAIVGAARVLINDQRGPAQFQIGARMMPKDIDWWVHQHKTLRALERRCLLRDDTLAVLRRVGVTEAQITAVHEARLLNTHGVRLVLLNRPEVLADDEVTLTAFTPERPQRQKTTSKPKARS